MAFRNTPAATYTILYVDSSGSRGRTNFHFPFGTSTTVLLAAADILRPTVLALTDCAIIGQSLTYTYFDDAPGSAAANSRVENKGQFIFRTSNARTTGLTIPAIKPSLLNTSGSINKLNPAVLAFVTELQVAGPIFCSADGSDIVSLEKAYQRFNRSTKNQLPTDR